jgi:hypothetical protein
VHIQICNIRGQNFVQYLYLRWYALGIYNFLKHVDHVVELSMDVTDDNDWLLDSYHVGLVA